MARAPITEQSRFGPAQSRARVFSAFVRPEEPDYRAAQTAQQAAEMFGQAAEFQQQREIEEAEELRQQGLEDYVAGRIRDGQRIVDGELQPIESEYYMAGVEMGRGRRRGRDVRMAFAQWATENPRPDIDAEPGEDGADPYTAWMEEGLAQAQAEAGVDPDSLTDLEMSEYAGVINQVRQRDAEEHIAFINRRAREESLATFNSDLEEMRISYDATAENAQELLFEGTENLMAAARADGLDMQVVKASILTQYENIATATLDTSVLENMPDRFKNARIEAARVDAVARVETRIRQDQLQNQSQYLRQIQELTQENRWDAAQALLDEKEEAGEIDADVARGVDQMIHNGRKQAAREAQDNNRAVIDNLLRDNAVARTQLDGTLQAGVSYVTSEGEEEYMTPDEVGRYFEQRVFAAHGGQTPQAFGELARMAEEEGVVSPTMRTYLQNPLSMSMDRLEGQNLSASHQAAIDTLVEMNPEAVSVFIEDEQMRATVAALQNIYQASPKQYNEQGEVIGGAFDQREALLTAMRVTDPNAPAPSRFVQGAFRREILDTLDDRHKTWRPLSGIFADQNNFDADSPAAGRWVESIAEESARIASHPEGGPQAAGRFMEAMIEGTMVINRDPVQPVGRIRGELGRDFLSSMAYTVTAQEIIPQVDSTFERNFVTGVLGLAEEENPFNPANDGTIFKHVEVRNVDDGVVFQYEDISIHRTTQQLHEEFARYVNRRSASQDWEAEEEARIYQALRDSEVDGFRDFTSEFFTPSEQSTSPNLFRD